MSASRDEPIETMKALTQRLLIYLTMRDGSLASEAWIAIEPGDAATLAKIDKLLDAISLRANEVRKALDPRFVVVEKDRGRR